jgi:hypothetical protein
MRTRPNQRTPEEASARGECRRIVRALGTYIRRTEDRKYVYVGECQHWPEGVYLEFHGWVDVLSRLMKIAPQEKVEC